MSLPEDSVYRRQLNRGFAGLRFAEPLETDFRLKYLTDNLVWLRRGLALVLAWTLFETLVDWVSFPDPGRQQTLASRSLLLVPCLLLTLSATYPRRTARLLPPLILLCAVVLCVATLWSQVIAHRTVAEPSSMSIGVAAAALFALFGLRFHTACLLVVALLAGWLGVHLFGAASPGVRDVFMVVCIAFIAAFVGYRLEHMARTEFLQRQIINLLVGSDELTGVPNRRLLNAHLISTWRQSNREGRNFAVALIDVDQFHDYNEHYGRHAGDVSLRRIAHALMRITRRPLDFTARFGGEEFAMVLFDPDEDYLENLAAQVRDHIAVLDIEHAASAVAPRVTVSLGIAFAKAGSRASAEALLELADEALQQAKSGGKDRHVIRRYVSSDKRGNVRQGPWAVPS